MESLDRLIYLITKNRVQTVRYILIFVGLFVTCSNLYDCVLKLAAPEEYILYVGVMGAVTFMLVVVNYNWAVVAALYFTGMLMVFDPSNGTTLSGAVLFFVFAQRIAETPFFSILLYFTTASALILKYTLEGRQPTEAINIILAYYACYMIDYIVSGAVKNE